MRWIGHREKGPRLIRFTVRGHAEHSEEMGKSPANRQGSGSVKFSPHRRNHGLQLHVLSSGTVVRTVEKSLERAAMDVVTVMHHFGATAAATLIVWSGEPTESECAAAENSADVLIRMKHRVGQVVCTHQSGTVPSDGLQQPSIAVYRRLDRYELHDIKCPIFPHTGANTTSLRVEWPTAADTPSAWSHSTPSTTVFSTLSRPPHRQSFRTSLSARRFLLLASPETATETGIGYSISPPSTYGSVRRSPKPSLASLSAGLLHHIQAFLTEVTSLHRAEATAGRGVAPLTATQGDPPIAGRELARPPSRKSHRLATGNALCSLRVSLARDVESQTSRLDGSESN